MIKDLTGSPDSLKPRNIGIDTNSNDTSRFYGQLASFKGRSSEGQAKNTLRYSYFVGVMRYGLPIIALILLGLIVIWPMMSGREEGFRITYSEMTEVDGSLKMVNARYMDTDERNQPFTVSASEASQPEPNSAKIILQNITADIFNGEEKGSWYALKANSGTYERNQKLLDLKGKVTLFSDAGHELVTESAHIDLGRGIAEGNQPVKGQSPLGLLNAGSFRLIEKGRTTLFGNRVKLVIFPNAHKS